jgi:hypothetical protein
MPTLVDNECKICFVHIPKTAGCWTNDVLEKVSRSARTYEPTTLEDAHTPAFLLVDNYPQYTFITIVRNPYTRFVSLFCMGKLLGLHSYDVSRYGIDEFCANGADFQDMLFFKPMSYFTHTTDMSRCLVHGISKFEDMPSTIHIFQKLFKVKLPEQNNSVVVNSNCYIHHSEYEALYSTNPSVINYINFENFGYPRLSVDDKYLSVK